MLINSVMNKYTKRGLLGCSCGYDRVDPFGSVPLQFTFRMNDKVAEIFTLLQNVATLLKKEEKSSKAITLPFPITTSAFNGGNGRGTKKRKSIN
jgi:hypothetical protein